MESWKSFTEIKDCRLCPRLVEYRELVSKTKVKRFEDQLYWGQAVPSFGDQKARLLVVGLAPAAHGANRTGRMFTGDRSGEWLFRALHRFGFANQPTSADLKDGLRLSKCLITAVTHCVPPANKPSTTEIANCQAYLIDELHRLRKTLRVVVPLGQISFAAFFRARSKMGLENPRPLPRFGHARKIYLSEGVTVVCSYHPSQQNTFTGRLTEGMFDNVFREARKIVENA